MNKSRIIAVALIAALAIFCYHQFADSPSDEGLQIGVNTNLNRRVEGVREIPDLVPTSDGTSGSALRKVIDIESIQMPERLLKLGVVLTTQAAEAGDAKAALALYYLAGTCRSGGAIWQRLTPDRWKTSASTVGDVYLRERCLFLASRGHSPIYWLEQSAAAGDLDAQVLFATNILSFNLAHYSITDTDLDVNGTNRQALKFLENSAKYGVRQSYEQLYLAYKTGGLGMEDDALAYANLFAISLLDGSGAYDAVIKNANLSFSAESQTRGKAIGQLYASLCCILRK